MSARRLFARAFVEGLATAWPILSALLAFVAGVGAIVGLLEGWGLWRGVYFGYVTALTIGYGDLVPTRVSTQLLALAAGFAGICTTALLAALAVNAFKAAPGIDGKR
jgi:Ion channel